MAQRVVTVNDVLDGHVVLDIDHLDRVYLNVPILQSSDQLVAFTTQHLGMPTLSRIAATGVAQEFQRVWTAYQWDTATATPQYTGRVPTAERDVQVLGLRSLSRPDYGEGEPAGGGRLRRRALQPGCGLWQ